MAFGGKRWQQKATESLRRSGGDWTAVDWGMKRERGQWIIDGMARDLAQICTGRERWTKAPEGAMESEWDYEVGREGAAVFIGHGPDESGNLQILAWFCAWAPHIEARSLAGQRDYVTFGRAKDAVEFIESEARAGKMI